MKTIVHGTVCADNLGSCAVGGFKDMELSLQFVLITLGVVQLEVSRKDQLLIGSAGSVLLNMRI